MAIYIVNLFIIVLYSIVYNMLKVYIKNDNKLKKAFVSIVIIQLILILSLRSYSVGADVQVYLSYFKSVNYVSFEELLLSHRFEVGYKILNKIISLLTTNEQIFLSVIAVLSIIPVGRLIYRYSKMPFLSFAIYIAFNYYSFTFSGLRQAIAYGIIFISYDFIIKKKVIKFIICIFFATLFHKSALIFLPAYFLSDLKLNKFSTCAILLFDIVIFVFRRQIFQIMINTFYDNYEVVESSSFTWMLMCLLILVCGLLFYKRVISVSISNNALYIFIIIGVSLMIFASVGTNVMRVADYYYRFIILFIPEVMHSIKDKRFVLMVGYILIILIFVLYLLFLSGNGFKIVPYRFFWEV